MDSWFDVFSFPKSILLLPNRGGKRVAKKAKSFRQLVEERIDLWLEGGKDHLWKTVLQAADHHQKKKKDDPSRLFSERRVVRLVRDGEVTKAFRTGIAPKTPETVEKLRSLHPPGREIRSPSSPLPQSPKFSVELVKSALRTFKPSSAGGVFGYKPALLQQCAKAESFHFPNTLARLVNCLAKGSLPEFVRPFLAGGSLLALRKGENGVRPFAAATHFGGWWPNVSALGPRRRFRSIFIRRISALGVRVE